MARAISDAELRRRKAVSSKITRTTSTLGLVGLGALGASAVAAKKPGALKKIPGLRNASPEKIKNVAFNTGVVSSGIGGVGGYNNAAIMNAESKKKSPVVKSTQHEMEPIYGEIAKAWSPTAGSYDPESQRHVRNEKQVIAGTATTGALATGAAGAKVRQLSLESKAKSMAGKKGVRAVRASAKSASKLPPKLAVGAAVTGAGTLALNHNRKNNPSWETYSKSAAWKTIDHRERIQRRDRRANKAAQSGASIGVGTALAAHKAGGSYRETAAGVNDTKNTYKTSRGLFHQSRKQSFGAAKNTAMAAARKKPQNAAIAGGAALALGSVGVGAFATGQDSYQQHKINQRRRENHQRRIKKSDSVSAFGISHD